MANGSDTAGNNRESGSLISALDNKVLLVLLAAGLGVGGNLAIVGVYPEARSDSFTGEQGKALEKRIERLERLQETGASINVSQKEQTIRLSAMLDSMERRLSINEKNDVDNVRESQGWNYRIQAIKDELKALKEDLKGSK